MILFRIAQVNVEDVLHDLFGVLIAIRPAVVLAGVERQAETEHVIAENLHGIWIFAQPTYLALHGYAHALGFGDADQLL